MTLVVPLFVVTAVLASIALPIYFRWRVAARAEFIRQYTWPAGLYEKLHKHRPQLTPKEFQLVGQALRQFFLAYLKSGRGFVSMPSQVADDLWHEFILYTRNYDHFCRRAFGTFLHHSPAAVLGSSRQSNAGLRRVWWHSCREERIEPRRPSRLPLLFAIDAKLQIPDGFRYATDCSGLRKPGEGQGDGAIIYCGGDFGSPGVDGSTEGFGDPDAAHASHGHGGGSGGDGGGDSGGHGCGGHGCGGGGCGGGGD
jgi:hypothetical protein